MTPGMSTVSRLRFSYLCRARYRVFVIPKTVEDVIAIVKQCRRYRAPLLARGGGTSQCQSPSLDA
jgi:FAD/FMN-containing dehydrogenase